jgi:hypothetical protein
MPERILPTRPGLSITVLKIIGKTDGSLDFHFYDFYGLQCRPLVKDGSHCVYSFRPLATFWNDFHKTAQILSAIRTKTAQVEQENVG